MEIFEADISEEMEETKEAKDAIKREKDMKLYLDWINETSFQKDTAYADYDLKPKDIPLYWRIIPIVLYLSSIVSSMVWVVALGGAQNDFHGFCVLFSNTKYTLLGSIQMGRLDDIDVTDLVGRGLQMANASVKAAQILPIQTNVLNGSSPVSHSLNLKTQFSNLSASSRNSSDFNNHQMIHKRSPNNEFESLNYLNSLNDNIFIEPKHQEPVRKVNTDSHPMTTTTTITALGHRNGYEYISAASIDYVYSSWGPSCICNFSLYVGVTSLIYGFLCCMFFLLCRMGHEQYSIMLEYPSRLVLPSLLLSFVFSLLTVVSSWMITRGVSLWCQGILEGPLEKCNDVQKYVWINNERHIMNTKRLGTFYSFLMVAKVSSWLTCSCWITSTLILMIRFFGAVDFYKEPSILCEPVFEGGNTSQASRSPAFGDESFFAGDTITMKQPLLLVKE